MSKTVKEKNLTTDANNISFNVVNDKTSETTMMNPVMGAVGNIVEGTANAINLKDKANLELVADVYEYLSAGIKDIQALKDESNEAIVDTIIATYESRISTVINHYADLKKHDDTMFSLKTKEQQAADKLTFDAELKAAIDSAKAEMDQAIADKFKTADDIVAKTSAEFGKAKEALDSEIASLKLTVEEKDEKINDSADLIADLRIDLSTARTNLEQVKVNYDESLINLKQLAIEEKEGAVLEITTSKALEIAELQNIIADLELMNADLEAKVPDANKVTELTIKLANRDGIIQDLEAKMTAAMNYSPVEKASFFKRLLGR